MIDASATINDCKLASNAKIGAMSTLLKTTLGEMCMVGSFSKMAYSGMDDLSYIGDYTVVINSTIKKFASISWGVTIGPEEHDYTRLTNHSFLYSLKSFSKHCAQVRLAELLTKIIDTFVFYYSRFLVSFFLAINSR